MAAPTLQVAAPWLVQSIAAMAAMGRCTLAGHMLVVDRPDASAIGGRGSAGQRGWGAGQTCQCSGAWGKGIAAMAAPTGVEAISRSGSRDQRCSRRAMAAVKACGWPQMVSCSRARLRPV